METSGLRESLGRRFESYRAHQYPSKGARPWPEHFEYLFGLTRMKLWSKRDDFAIDVLSVRIPDVKINAILKRAACQ